MKRGFEENVPKVRPRVRLGRVDEMVEEEVETAHKESQVRGGRPRLLPVRIQLEGPLPAKLGQMLDRLQYFLWQSPSDDPRLVEELQAALRGPPPALHDQPPPAGVLPQLSPGSSRVPTAWTLRA